MDEQNDVATREEMNLLYGSFMKALYTMFEITHSGSWPARVRPVIDKVSPWYALPFLGYITLVVFAVIRVVTALFLKAGSVGLRLDVSACARCFLEQPVILETSSSV